MSTTFQAAGAGVPVSWLNFSGRWGDAQPRDERTIFGEAKYVAGPSGPKFKDLVRRQVCPSEPCVVMPTLAFSGGIRRGEDADLLGSDSD